MAIGCLHTLVVATFAILSGTQNIFVAAYSHHQAPNLINRWMHAANPQEFPRTSLASATFEQLIDHDNPGIGTFPQFYYYSNEFWGGPGSPVILFTPGEVNATAYSTYLGINRTTGVIAKEIGAAVVVLEHRYWGTSTPFTNLSTDNLQYLTLKNSVADMVNFAKNAHLPFDSDQSSQATHAPWVFVGGSYSGALAAWIESTSPGTFWAYYSSSAPVQAMDYWQYFVPVQEGMAQNCSRDITRVIDYVDAVGTNGTKAEKKALQTRFGLGALEHYDDFASALQNGPWLWQGNQFYQNSGFFNFCDAIENVGQPDASPSPGADGVGLEKALAGYARWYNTTMLPGFCQSYGYADWQDLYSVSCLDTYNASSPLFTDWSPSNQFDRQWVWMTCNEPFGYWQDSPPTGRPSIVSRFVTQQYWERQCALFFPTISGETYGLAKGRTFDELNSYTGGWFIDNSTQLTYANGQYDPWREASVSSEFRPGGPLASTAQVPVNVVPGGFHTSDLVTRNGVVNAGCQSVIDAGVKNIADWVAQWAGPKKALKV